MIDAPLAGDEPATFTLRPDVQPLDPALAGDQITHLPRGRRVLVDLCDVRPAEAVNSRIFTDATVDGAIEYGLVRATGPKVEDPEIRVGAVVMFGKFSGYGIDAEKAMLLREDDVMMVVQGGVVRLRTEREAMAAEEVRRAASHGSLGVAESARIVAPGANWRNQAAQLDEANRELTASAGRPAAKSKRSRKRRGY